MRIPKQFAKKKEDLLKEPINVMVTLEEKEFVMRQAKEEFTSQNSIIRKCINFYKKNNVSIPK